jgi:heme/copper-type cytochrome/quinol oxidase subunit 4
VQYLRLRITQVWFVLAGATVLSWWLAGGPGVSQQAVTSGLFVVAFVKVWLVVHYFMEVRTAPRPLRLIADGWVVATCCTILAIYWMASP